MCTNVVIPIYIFVKILIVVRRNTSIISNPSAVSASAAEENLNDSVEQILAEATDSYRPPEDDDTTRSTNTDGELTEEEMIVYDMDHDVPTSRRSAVLRRRLNASNTSSSFQVEPSTSNENLATNSTLSRASDDSNRTSTSNITQQQPTLREEDRISIKLKYLNDEIKTVSGYSSETIGNFKRYRIIENCNKKKPAN